MLCHYFLFTVSNLVLVRRKIHQQNEGCCHWFWLRNPCVFVCVCNSVWQVVATGCEVSRLVTLTPVTHFRPWCIDLLAPCVHSSLSADSRTLGASCVRAEFTSKSPERKKWVKELEDKVSLETLDAHDCRCLCAWVWMLKVETWQTSLLLKWCFK